MSLTSFVKKPFVRDRMGQIFHRPPLESKPTMLAPPLTTNFLLLGTAFDYALRFKLMKLCPNVQSQTWIAEKAIFDLCAASSFAIVNISQEETDNAFMIFSKHGPVEFYNVEEMLSALPDDRKKFLNFISKERYGGFLEDPFEELLLIRKCYNYLQDAKKELNKYLDTGVFNDDLIRAAIRLSKLDGFYRAGFVPLEMDNINPDHVKDVSNLINITPDEEFVKFNNIMLNPDFGSYSQDIGGADADLILDHVLIDIKTVQKYEILKDNWHQLVGYAILGDLAREADPKYPRFDKVGIYFSRYGKLWTVSSDIIYDNPEYQSFKEWFIETARKEFDSKIEFVED